MKQPRVLRCAYRLLLVALSMALAAQLAGCGGGTNLASGGIVGTGITDIAQQGEITALGTHSIVVNGQTISTVGATVMINGQSAPDTSLMVGMVVTIITTTAANSAAQTTRIEYHAEVRGMVSGVDSTAQAFTVLGQRVRTNNLTIFIGGTFATLLNQSVEVSAFRSTPGDLLATLVIIAPSSNPPPPAPQVTGVVSALDTAAHTFSIGLQLCDYSAVAATAVPEGFANGATVRVSGTQPSSGGTLLVTSITVLAPSLPDAGQAEVEGLITAFAGLGSFQVNGQQTDGSTAVIDGGSADLLGNGLQVNVEGKLVSGVLVASKIEIEGATVVQIDGTAQAVDPIGGTVTVGGQAIAVRASTQFIDSSSAALRNFSLSAVQVGDRLSISALHSGSALVATRVERLNPTAPPPTQPPTSIQGTITNFASIANFVVAGQQVDAGAATFVGGNASALANGQRVKVDGTLVNGILDASTVTFLSNAGPESVTVTGAIANFVSASSFTVAGQLVDASGANFINGRVSDLANGVNVTVTGAVHTGTLVAQSVTYATPPPTTLQLDGLISNFVSLSSFVVQQQAVNATQATISNGTASDLANGVKVSVGGPLQNGVLMATTVKIESTSGPQQKSVEGVITNFVAASNFTVAGQQIDATNAHFDGGSVADLANGKNVDVQGVLVGQVLQAQDIEFQDE